MTQGDLYKCFDKLSLKECCNDLYEAGITDDRLNMIYEGSKTNRVALNTPIGQTNHILIEENVTQGGPLGPIQCSLHIDKIGKEALERDEYLFLYKNVKIPPLSMMADLACLSKCGIESIESNAYINSKIEQKQLKFNEGKCHQLHIKDSNNNDCPTIKVHDKFMMKSTKDKYLGDVITNDGKNHENIKHRALKGVGIVSSIINLLKELNLGQHYFQAAILFRDSLFLSSI